MSRENQIRKVQTIYTPGGSAGEYSPYGLNPYWGCDNHCFYCYQKAMTMRFQPTADFGIVKARAGFIESLIIQAPKFKGCKQVTMCFSCDPYNKLNNELQLTRQSLQILLENKICVAILTKCGLRSSQDTDIILSFGKHIKVGTTLTYVNKSDSLKYESGAALPAERLKMLQYWHELRVDTWASFEPVMSPKDSLILMEMAMPYCDKFKIGKLNHYPAIEKKYDWAEFLDDSVMLMRRYNKKFIVKSDLLKFNQGTVLMPEEINPRALDVPPFMI